MSEALARQLLHLALACGIMTVIVGAYALIIKSAGVYKSAKQFCVLFFLSLAVVYTMCVVLLQVLRWDFAFVIIVATLAVFIIGNIGTREHELAPQGSDTREEALAPDKELNE
jgi:hypothetical protein